MYIGMVAQLLARDQQNTHPAPHLYPLSHNPNNPHPYSFQPYSTMFRSDSTIPLPLPSFINRPALSPSPSLPQSLAVAAAGTPPALINTPGAELNNLTAPASATGMAPSVGSESMQRDRDSSTLNLPSAMTLNEIIQKKKKEREMERKIKYEHEKNGGKLNEKSSDSSTLISSMDPNNPNNPNNPLLTDSTNQTQKDPTARSPEDQRGIGESLNPVSPPLPVPVSLAGLSLPLKGTCLLIENKRRKSISTTVTSLGIYIYIYIYIYAYI